MTIVRLLLLLHYDELCLWLSSIIVQLIPYSSCLLIHFQYLSIFSSEPVGVSRHLRPACPTGKLVQSFSTYIVFR